MILRRLRVQHFRCFRNPVELSGLGVGIHVVHAPNETGKSSLVLALARALFDRNSTRDREIQNLRPWGTTLSPRVTLELDSGGKRYRLEKAFLDDATSLLDEWTGTRFERLADSQRADEMARGFLFSGGAQAGATKPGQWGLARLLWLGQSAERHVLPGLDTPLKARLMEAVGVAVLSEQEQGVLKRVEDAYRQFFTLKKGKVVTGSELELKAALVASLEEELRGIRAQQEASAEHARDMEEARSALGDLAGERGALEARFSALQARVEAETQLEQQIALRDKDVERQHQEWEHLDGKQRELLALRQNVARHQAVVAEKEPVLQKAREGLIGQEASFRQARELFQAQLGEQEKAEQRQERGRLLEKARQALVEQQRLDGQLKQGERLETAVEGLRRRTAALKTLSESDVKRAEDVERKLRQAQDKLEARGIEVVFKAEGSRSIEWEAEGQVQRHELAKAEQKLFAGVSAGSLRIKGVGEVRVRTGAEEIGNLQADVEKFRKELTRRLHEHGVESPQRLRGEWESQQVVLQEQAKHEGALETFLEAAGFESVEALREKRREQAGKVGTLAGQLNLAVAALATYPTHELVVLSEELRLRKQEVKEREKAKDDAEAVYRQVERQVRGLAQERDSAMQTARELELTMKAQLHALGMSLEQLGAEVERAHGELERLKNMVTGLRARLPRPEERAATQRRQLDEARERVVGAEKKAQERIIRAETLLGRAAEAGVYSRWGEAEERLVLATEEHLQLKTRAEAAEILRKLVGHWQEQVNRTFVAPIQDAVHARLEHIRGDGRNEVLSLGPEFIDAAMETPDGARSLASFSWGMQEQTLFALRLALGEMLSKQGTKPEPQLVVLDDALVNTDAVRHRRALELIEKAGESLQVLILTAFPERYRTLRGMKEFDLRELAQESTPAG
ncbi:hypothetical protein HUA76_37620 [Myxococcus sp. CA056]|uniref:hypothetical protein n=1 Tax=Myxococcus sp. CA056 TaxID=2741740 RepID=UPI00157A8226|nr:hypothetical protein [Myxococcus sp. CA056]NTX16507.1 hypothetical protein [Myxococcus sp. CA056]